jgi:hypothetical protein
MSRLPELAVNEAIQGHLGEIEAHLGALDAALASGNADCIEQQSQTLQMGLAQGLAAFRQAAARQASTPGASLPNELHHRLMLARMRCLQQQQAVQLASASLGRTLGALFPSQDGPQGATYGVPGQGAGAWAMSAYR